MVSSLLEAYLDEARAGDHVAVLFALNVIGGILEDVDQLAALQAEAYRAVGARRSRISQSVAKRGGD